MKTKLLLLATGIYIRRDRDAIEIITTGDQLDPRDDEGNILSKNRVSVEQFADTVNTTAPEAKGELVNVGTDAIPLPVAQSMAPRFQAIIAAGGADKMADLVDIGRDGLATLLLTPAQVEQFNAIVLDAIHTNVEGAVQAALAESARSVADTAAKIDASRVNVGADAGLELKLLPGEAEIFKQLVDFTVQAAVARATKPLTETSATALKVASVTAAAPVVAALEASVTQPLVDVLASAGAAASVVDAAQTSSAPAPDAAPSTTTTAPAADAAPSSTEPAKTDPPPASVGTAG